MRPNTFASIILVAGVIGTADAGDAAATRPPPTDAELVKRVERLGTDPFRLVTTLYPKDEVRKTAQAPSTAYRADARTRRQTATADLNRTWTGKVAALLDPALAETFTKADGICAAHHRRAAEIRARPGKVIEEVTGKRGLDVYRDRVDVARHLPGLSAEATTTLDETLKRQWSDVYRRAEERALDGKKRPSMRDRKAWRAYKDRRRTARREVAAELRPAHLEEVITLLDEEQGKALQRIFAAVDRRTADLEAERVRLVAELTAALGEEALVAAVQRRQDLYAEARQQKIEPVEKEDLPRLVYAPRDPFAVARTFFALDEETAERLSTLRREYAVELAAVRRTVDEAVARDHLDAALAVLPEDARAAVARAYELLRTHDAARRAVEKGYTVAAEDAGLTSTSFPHSFRFLLYRAGGGDAELSKRLNEAMNALSRDRYRRVQAELKRRGVDRNSPDYAAVSAEVNAAITAEIEERQLAEARKILGEERAAALDTLVPVYRAISQSREKLALQTGKQLLELFGTGRLMGPPREAPRR